MSDIGLRYIFLVLVLLAISNPSNCIYAQNREYAKLELLQEKLKTAQEDTNKVKLLQSISFQYNSINPDLGIEYGKQSLELAKKLEWDFGIAKAYNSIGGNLFALGSLKEALEYFKKSLSINEDQNYKIGMANNYGNIGNIYYNLSNYSEALNYYQKALKLDSKKEDKEGVAANLGSIGNIYSELSDYKLALKYYERALKMHKSIDNRRGIATVMGNIGIAYLDLQEYDKALKHFNKALELWQLFGNKFGISTNLGNIANTYNKLHKYEEAMANYEEALKLNLELGNKFGTAAIMGNMGGLYFELSQDSVIKKLQEKGTTLNLNKATNLELAIVYSEKATNMASEIGAKYMLMDWYSHLDKAYASKGQYEKAYRYQEKWSELRDSIFSVDKTKEIAKLEATKQKQINEKEISLKNLQLLRKSNEQFILFASLGGLAIVLVVIFLQRRKSEKLLLNILPYKIAKRLKNNETRIADRFEETSIIFIDIVRFTNYSEDTDPVKVVAALNEIFTKFDILAKKYGLEKIKTIGDCYMAAAGLPEPHPEHKLATARFALEVKKVMQDYLTPEGFHLLFRIGIDSGAVVAGVIGERKFSYDLWGDAVNTASRMESTGLPNEIQITEQFAQGLENHGFKCVERGEIEVKGKGRVKTYLLRENNSDIMNRELSE